MLRFILIIITVLISLNSTAQRKKPIRVLIVDGFSNHDWKQTTRVTKWILEETGRFLVEVSTIPADSIERTTWLPVFTQYDVIVQNTNNIQNKRLKWPIKAEKALETYVANGGGLFILHSGNNAYPHWEEYDKMIGMGWRPATTGYALEIGEDKKIIRIPPGEGKGTGHGDRFNAVIQKLNNHPINDGYPTAWQTANTEVYSFPRGPAQNLTILSYAFDSTDTHKLWPVEWVISYGKGRVYNSSMGHLWQGETYPPAYRCIGFQTTIIRVTEWLATGKVKHPIPANFPTETAVSLRPESSFPTNPNQ